MDRISKQEFILGAISVSGLTFKLGINALWLMALCGALWAIGGTFNKAYRRVGVPISVLTFSIAILGLNWWFLACLPVSFGILCIGDGFPDNRPTTRDEGSVLGRFVEIFVSDENGGGLITKCLVVLFLQVAWIPIWIA